MLTFLPLLAHRKVSQDQGTIWAPCFSSTCHHLDSLTDRTVGSLTSPTLPTTWVPSQRVFLSLNLACRALVLTLQGNYVLSASLPHCLYCQGLDLILPYFFLQCMLIYYKVINCLWVPARRHKTTKRDKKALLLTDGTVTWAFACLHQFPLPPRTVGATQRT